MLFTLFFRRLGFGLLLVFTLVAGWLLHGMILASTNTSVGRSSSVNSPLSSGNVPISSQLGTSTRNKPVEDFALNSIRSDEIKLTAGLHPGRGQAIPAAADVAELPVKDVSFYNWRGELLSGWLALGTPEAPVIMLTHRATGKGVRRLQRAGFCY